MFIEPHRRPSGRGWIEVICGPMFSGKTEELIRRLNEAQVSGQNVAIFKPAIDNRYDATDIVSHNMTRIPSTPVDGSRQVLLLSPDVEVIGIDEAQFFDNDLAEVAGELAGKGIRVIVAGLDMDYMGRPFGAVPSLLARAECITKLQAICVQCGEAASFSHRRTKVDDKILLGEKDVYEPRCRNCFGG